MIQVFYKVQDGQVLTTTGHFNKREIMDLKCLGYRQHNPKVNKHGIRLVK